MRLAFLAALGWCMLAAGIVDAAPARPLYEPPTPPSLPVYHVRDTQWAGIEAPDRNIYFHSDGTLGYLRGQRTFGTWKLEGNTVYFEFNKRYREFRGVIKSNIIDGESWNVTGKRWRTQLRRVDVPPLGPVP